ncbi:acyltransferase family protein [Citrobacter freundii]|uniref:acyltransferase family protein n=1 Tax=Citrobacter freundii TaxID=546 RepID=UPI0039895ECC
MENRNHTIDIARGISILSMVGLHSHLSDGYYYPLVHEIFVKYLMLYLVPFFFFISGVFYKEMNYRRFVFLRFSTIMKPVFFTVIFYNLFFWDNNWVDIFNDMYGVFQFPLYALWFMPTLLVTMLVCAIIIKSKSSNIKTLSALVVLVAFTSNASAFSFLDWSDSNALISSRLPFTAESLIFTVPLFMCGYYFRNDVAHFKISIGCFLFFFASMVFFVIKYGVVINIGSFVFKPYLFCLISSLFSIYVLLCVSKICGKLSVVSHCLRVCGRDSLYIALFHGPLLYFLAIIINNGGILNLSMLAKDLIVFFLSVIMSLIIKNILALSKPTRWMFAIRKM